MASRWVFVIREINKPCVVDLISNAEEASGAVVPMPALPVEGNIFVWAGKFFEIREIKIDKRKNGAEVFMANY